MAHRPTYLDRVHTHPLTFPLDALDQLDSLSLSLIQFHLDNDEEGFDRTLDAARTLWRTRRARAIASGERLEGEVVPPPPPKPPLVDRFNAPPPIPHVFLPLVETIRAAPKQHGQALKAHVGSDMRSKHPDCYRRDPRLDSFKALAGEAERLGIVEMGRSNVQGRDWIALKEPFRDDLPDLRSTAEGKVLQEAIESEFWRRRSEAVERGEEWEDPPPSSFIIPAAAVPPPTPAYPPTMVEGISVSYPSIGNLPRPASVLSSLSSSLGTSATSTPPLNARLPLALSSTFQTLDIGNLPASMTASALNALLPTHLVPLATIVYSAQPPQPPQDPQGPRVRRAHVAFRSSGLAGAAQAQLNVLRLRENGHEYAVSAAPIKEGSVQPGWEWGDVRAEGERAELWKVYGDGVAGGDSKRGRNEEELTASSKKPRLSLSDRPPEQVLPSSLVPPSLLSSLYSCAFSFQSVPAHIKEVKTIDDLFVHRFRAVGWRAEPEASTSAHGTRFILLFKSSRDAIYFEEWVANVACRYWKHNGTRAGELPLREAQRLEWRQRDFTPAWRTEHGFVLRSPNADGKVKPTAGELGDGENVPPGHRVGWQRWEYVLQGLPLPPPPGSLASRFGALPNESKWGRADSPAPSNVDGHAGAHSRSSSRNRSGRSVEPDSSTFVGGLASRLGHRAASPTSSIPSIDSSASLLPPPVPSSVLSVRGPANVAAVSAMEQPPVSPISTVSATSGPAPADALLDDVPAFGSALSAARISPSSSLTAGGNSKHNRRPTASELNEFETSLDALLSSAVELVGSAAEEQDPQPLSKGETKDGDEVMRDAQLVLAEVKQESHAPSSASVVVQDGADQSPLPMSPSPAAVAAVEQPTGPSPVSSAVAATSAAMLMPIAPPLPIPQADASATHSASPAILSAPNLPAAPFSLSAPSSPICIEPQPLPATVSRSVSPSTTTKQVPPALESLIGSSSTLTFPLSSEPVHLFPTPAPSSTTTSAGTALPGLSASNLAPSSSSTLPAPPRTTFGLPAKPTFQAELPLVPELPGGVGPAKGMREL
ncbi:hypothetical protein JCM10213v2_007166 [Rhodosporidiobolus nylandii]